MNIERKSKTTSHTSEDWLEAGEIKVNIDWTYKRLTGLYIKVPGDSLIVNADDIEALLELLAEALEVIKEKTNG